jgi:hypothetical protein
MFGSMNRKHRKQSGKVLTWKLTPSLATLLGLGRVTAGGGPLGGGTLLELAGDLLSALATRSRNEKAGRKRTAEYASKEPPG